MKKIFSILLLVFVIQGFSQDLKSVILENTLEIRSNNPNDSIFPDLEILKETIGNKRIVMLGEQDHGDAATFEAKTRIVKFLHQEMDFDVIVFESGFFGMQAAWDNIDSAGIDPVLDVIYPMWTGCEQNTMLFKWIRNKVEHDNVIITGIDSRHVMTMYRQPNYFYDNLSELMSEIGTTITEHDSCTRFVEVMKEIMQKEYSSKANSSDKQLFYSFLNKISGELEKTLIKNKSFWLQELRNMEGHARNAWENNLHKEDLRDIRDEQMADNLLWLARIKYPNKKIIVWAANNHIVKNGFKPNANVVYVDGMYTEDGYNDAVSMGRIINDSIGNEMYVLGFTSYAGMGGRVTVPNKFEISPASTGTYEGWIHSKGYNFAFTDMIKVNAIKSDDFTSRLFGHKRELRNKWSNMFDGVYYIDKMYSCKPK
jgi:erythromycin esterase